jgi:hypothetical protein
MPGETVSSNQGLSIKAHTGSRLSSTSYPVSPTGDGRKFLSLRSSWSPLQLHTILTKALEKLHTKGKSLKVAK